MNGALIVSAFMLGLAGSGHCVAMCGGASGWIMRLMAPDRGSLLRFHAGRIAGYALLGLVAALAGQVLQGAVAWTAGALRPLWTMTNLAAFVLGASLLLTGRQPVAVERFGTWFARRLQRLQGGAVPVGATSPAGAASPGGVPLRVDAAAAARAGAAPGAVVASIPVASIGRAGASASHRRAWSLGACWALMPCGLLYSALVLAALSGDAGSGALSLGAFAAASAVPMLAVQRLLARRPGWLARWERSGNRLIGATICALAGFGVYMVVTGQGQGLFCLPA